MSTLYDELRDLIAALSREGVEYALCGGIAMAIHGRPRATVDIDMLILGESLSDALRTAGNLGYTVRGLDMSFPKDVIVSKLTELGRPFSHST